MIGRCCSVQIIMPTHSRLSSERGKRHCTEKAQINTKMRAKRASMYTTELPLSPRMYSDDARHVGYYKDMLGLDDSHFQR